MPKLIFKAKNESKYLGNNYDHINYSLYVRFLLTLEYLVFFFKCLQTFDSYIFRSPASL